MSIIVLDKVHVSEKVTQLYLAQFLPGILQSCDMIDHDVTAMGGVSSS